MGSNRLGTCQGCAARPARYSCPRCQFASCSLACSTQHKVAAPCTGVALPVHAVPMPAAEWTWGTLMRDQSYISSVSRLAEDKGRIVAEQKLIPSVRGGAPAAEGRLDDKSDKEESLVRGARNEGVDLVLLSKGMSRRTRNSSRWDPKEKSMEWCFDVVFHPASSTFPDQPPPTTITSTNFPSTTPVAAVIRAAMDSRSRKGKGKELPPLESKLRDEQRIWIDSLLPSAPSTSSAVVPAVEAAPTVDPTPEPLSQLAEASSLFVVLLPLRSIPSRVADSSDSRPSTLSAPSKQFYLFPPLSIIRTALQGTSILEHPIIEIWPLEIFEKAVAAGSVEVVDKPDVPDLPTEQGGGRGSPWERGRGRGRGRGSAGGRGRGTGERGATEGARPAQPGWESGVADSGWGKRTVSGVDLDEGDERGDKKRKTEAPPAIIKAATSSTEAAVTALLVEPKEKGGGDVPISLALVDYNSD